MRLIIIKLIYILLVVAAIGAVILSVVSCSPEIRMARLARKHPELLKKDTLRIKDSIIVPGSYKDSSFFFTGDTVRIENGRQEIKYFYNTTNHHNYISGTVKPDTIVKYLKVPYDKVVVQEKKSWQDKPSTYMILGLLILLAILAIISKFKK